MTKIEAKIQKTEEIHNAIKVGLNRAGLGPRGTSNDIAISVYTTLTKRAGFVFYCKPGIHPTHKQGRIIASIAAGIDRARDSGLYQPHDIRLAIISEIKAAGFLINYSNKRRAA